jgi:hypothetical protein
MIGALRRTHQVIPYQQLTQFPRIGVLGAIPSVPACLRQMTGCTLTTLFGTIEYKEVSEVAETPRKKHGWLPLLTVLFMISYGLMTMLIVEQGQTIESQRALIRELFRDSTELSATKMKAVEEHNHAQALAQNPSSQNPSTQAPSIQAPMKQAPSSQAGSQQRAHNQLKPKADFQMPSKPAADLADHRRSLITI